MSLQVTWNPLYQYQSLPQGESSEPPTVTINHPKLSTTIGFIFNDLIKMSATVFSSAPVRLPLSTDVLEIIDLVEKEFNQHRNALNLKSGDVDKGLMCPISHELLLNPVFLSCDCEQAYNRGSIENWLKTSNTCPTCRKEVKIASNLNKKQLEKIWHIKQDILVNCEKPKRESPARAKYFLEKAKEVASTEELALKYYQEAYKWTRCSTDYKEVVDHYTQSGDLERAKCAKLYLAIQQLKENHLKEALETFQSFEDKNETILLLINRLHAEVFLSSDDMAQITPDKLMDIAASLPKIKRQQIYRELIKKDSNYLPAYLELETTVQTWNETNKLLRRGEEIAQKKGDWDAEEILQSRIGRHPPIDCESWGNTEAIREIAPWPQELEALMSGPDKDSYYVCPIPNELAIGEEIVLATIENINNMVKIKGHPGINILGNVRYTPERGFPCKDGRIGWLVMNKTSLSDESKHVPHYKQATHIKKWVGQRNDRLGFGWPSVRDAVLMNLWKMDTEATCYRGVIACAENDTEGNQMTVGNANDGSIAIYHTYPDSFYYIDPKRKGAPFNTVFLAGTGSVHAAVVARKYGSFAADLPQSRNPYELSALEMVKTINDSASEDYELGEQACIIA